jgi:CheY-like chemotaxis protein
LVEDNLPDALLVQEAIKAEHLLLEVHVAGDGEQALDFIARAEKDPDAPCPHILLLDLNLPKVEGLEVLQRIRSRPKWKNLPVLVVTSSDSPADRKDVAALGASYFRKPVTYDEFLEIGPILGTFLKQHGLL